MRALLFLAAGAAASSLRPSHAQGHLSPASRVGEPLEALRFAATPVVPSSEERVRAELAEHFQREHRTDPIAQLDAAFPDSSGGPDSYKVAAAAALSLALDGPGNPLDVQASLCGRNVHPSSQALGSRIRAACGPFTVKGKCGTVNVAPASSDEEVYESAAVHLLGHGSDHFSRGRSCAEIKNTIMLVADALKTIKKHPGQVSQLSAVLKNDAYKYYPVELRKLGRKCRVNPKLALKEAVPLTANSPLGRAQAAAAGIDQHATRLAQMHTEKDTAVSKGPANNSKRRKREHARALTAMDEQIEAFEQTLPALVSEATRTCIIWLLHEEPNVVEHVSPCSELQSSCTQLGKSAANKLALFFRTLSTGGKPFVVEADGSTIVAEVTFSSIAHFPHAASSKSLSWDATTSDWI